MSNLLKEGPWGGNAYVILIILLLCVGFMLCSVFQMVRMHGLMCRDMHINHYITVKGILMDINLIPDYSLRTV